MKQTQKINELLDWYASLLTDKQVCVMNMYFKEDYSLAEIAENLEISRAAVSDQIKRTNKLLEDYEEKLKLVEKYKNRKEIYDKMKHIENEELIKLVESLEEND
ncbi:MAG: YlxM family DNA-binding protein [Erysipelotrichaceae bacterium]